MAAAFNSGYGFGSADSEIFGGFAFETDRSSGTGARESVPVPPPAPSYAPERADRLSGLRGISSAPSRYSAPEDDVFEDDFDSDYDDDGFDSDRVSDAYCFDDDFDDDDYYPSPRRSSARRYSRPRTEEDDYYGRPMREEPEYDDYRGHSAPPTWFEQLYDGDRGGYSTRSERNRVTSRAMRARMRVLSIAAGVVGAAAMVALIVGYFVYFRVSQPLNVVTAFSSLTTSSSYTLIKDAIDPTLGEQTYTINIDGTPFTFKLSDFEFGLAVPGVTEKTSQKELTDDEGNETFETMSCVENVVFNETLLRKYLNKIAMEKGGSEMYEPYYEIRDDKLMVYAGTDGYGVEFNSFIAELVSRIKSGSTEPIVSQMVTTKASPVNIDEIYSEVACQAADASYTTDAAGQMIWIDEVVGKDFDLEAARAAISVGGTAWNIQLTLTQPDVHLAELRAPYCLDLISSVTTEFSVTNTGRVQNIMQACANIDGTVLQPKADGLKASEYTFSYNDTVGERTPANGFCKATVYTSEGTDEDYGGGICQVSSTLYYAAEKALLGITERWNHVYTVHYLDSGLDATVSWGAYDLKFENTREYPVMIKAYVKGGTVTCEIWGTADGYTGDLKRDEGAIVYPKTLYYHYDPTKTNQAGQLGVTVRTYRVTYYNGKEVNRKFAYESKYQPLNNVYFVNSLPAGKTWSD